jgi:hypothetical protein
MPKQRFFGLLIDREEEPTPKWWGFGKEIYQTLLEALLSDDYANFMDPYNGLDAEVSVVTKAGNKTEYSAPKLVFKRKESRLAADKTAEQSIYDSITPLSEVFKPLTSAEMTQALEDYLTFDRKDTEEVVKGGTSKSSSDDEPPVEDIEAAFKKALES